MVFVTLGTSKYKFNRLIKYILDSNIKDVIVQSGFTKCPENIKSFKILSKDEMDKYINSADFVITHGGITIMELLHKNKKVIAIPRERKYKEAINDHQYEICDVLANEGYILTAHNYNEFKECLKKIQKIKLKKYKSDNKFYLNLNKIISNFLK